MNKKQTNTANKRRNLSLTRHPGESPKAALIDISSAGGYGPGMTTALFAAALYYAPLS